MNVKHSSSTCDDRVHVVDIINAAGLDGTYGTCVETLMIILNRDLDDDTNDDTDDGTDDGGRGNLYTIKVPGQGPARASQGQGQRPAKGQAKGQPRARSRASQGPGQGPARARPRASHASSWTLSSHE